jgi:prepilin-type N-terminal cleavage/methylation domain-containing protein
MAHPSEKKPDSGFTVLELLVAVSVTALLAGMLLNITSQVVSTQTQASSDLETNQVAQFILDRIQEDLHCAVYRNDGNVWMAANILEDTTNSGSWVEDDVVAAKPINESLRIVPADWTTGPNDPIAEANNQLALMDARFGVAGTFLRFLTQAPELDPDISNTGGGRAVSYQIIRHGLTKATTSRARYQLFRSDVTTEETFLTGYNLHPTEGKYIQGSSNGSRKAGNIINPIFNDSDGKSTAFSLASNVIDFGIRAYFIQKNSAGEGSLVQIFPDVNASNGGGNPPYNYIATNNLTYISSSGKPAKYSKFPEVIDVMVRILSTEGASAISAFEEGLIPTPQGYSPAEFWWDIADKNSEVYIRRIRVFSGGI